MKQVNQLLHQTGTLGVLESIIENGFYTSYTEELLAGKKLLIPMVSFSNIMFRDIGEREVVDYGSYGIGISRETGMKYDLNPVVYVYENSLVENGVHENFGFSILPQTLSLFKKLRSDFKTNKVNSQKRNSELISFKPLPSEVKNLIDSISENTDDDLIESIKNLFGKIFETSHKQIMLLKPYKVENTEGQKFIAYNEREWRKTFFDLNFYYEFTPSNVLNPEFIKWKKIDKPHFKDKDHTLQIPLEDIKYIIVKEVHEIDYIKNFIIEKHNRLPENILIDTLQNFKEKEEKYFF